MDWASDRHERRTTHAIASSRATRGAEIDPACGGALASFSFRGIDALRA